ncbi:MAG: RnfABCDGE type electron transport complex subunit B [Clostridiales bacterium]|jgi:Na+-translocating ferredoxin:NAD+ oxidoreductase RNF subunit RnfB|nr:RnfABCDGE type electron transport complex subunit B [Clostridiales bacterium]
MIEAMLVAIFSVGGLALVFGIILGFSARKCAVKGDPRVDRIINVLPGANCGACGQPGCSMFAEKVVKGEADYKSCSPGGASAAAEIAEHLGVKYEGTDRMVAFVKCNGSDDNVKRSYIYDGPKSCVAASQLATGGNKKCLYSCIGHESCKHACPFDAIEMKNNIAVVNTKKCTGCSKCVQVCPKNIIEMVPDKAKVRMPCNSRDKGKVVRENCRAGCINCNLCIKACGENAIGFSNNVMTIDYDKCTMCLECVNKCPVKAIRYTV